MGYAHGIKWTREKVKEYILEVVKFYNLNRMPSRNELNEYYKDCRLTSRISKEKGGYYLLAKELKLPMKKSDTNTGKTYEYKIKELLEKMNYKVDKMAQNYPYDLLINDSVKIDVKVSRLYRHKDGFGFYSYNLEKKHPRCDIYILVTVNENKQEIYVVPSVFVANNTQISIGEYESKYSQYKDKYIYIDNFIDFFKSLY